MATEKQSDKKAKLVLLGFVAAVLLTALLIFGLGKNEWGHTGFELVAYQGAGYVLTIVFFLVLAMIAGYFVHRIYQREQTLTVSVAAAALVAIVFFALAFGKGCTLKANDGVTGPKGRPQTETFPQ